MTMKMLLLCSLLAVGGCATPEKSAVVDRKSRPYVLALASIGGDARDVFKKELERGQLGFLAIGQHQDYETCWFPGLSREQVDEYITRRKVPFKVQFENLAPFVVTKPGENVDSQAYWAAVDDFLTIYNHVALEELKRRGAKPNQSSP